MPRQLQRQAPSGHFFKFLEGASFIPLIYLAQKRPCSHRASCSGSAYDAICAARSAGIKADVEYLRVLHLAASTVEDDVERALVALLAEGAAVTADAVKARCAPPSAPAVPALEAPAVDLAAYDSLLVEVAS